MPAYKIEGLAKLYDGGKTKTPIHALKNVHFSVEPGELFVVLGSAGSGKTTLLRLLANLEKPDQGEVQVEGQNFLQMGWLQRATAMVFQNFPLYPQFSIQKNLEICLQSKNRKLSESEIGARVAEMSVLLELFDKLSLPTQHLSDGDQFRVALGRALIGRPQLLLLDDPFAQFNAIDRVKFRSLFRQWQRKLGITTILVTQDDEDAMSLADHLLVLDQGQVQQIGLPEEIFQNPKNTTVAKLMGNVILNLIPVEKAIALGLPSGKGKYVGIRPERLRVIYEASEGAIVQEIQPLGEFSLVVIQAEDFILRVLVSPTREPVVGSTLRLRVDPLDLLWMNE